MGLSFQTKKTKTIIKIESVFEPVIDKSNLAGKRKKHRRQKDMKSLFIDLDNWTMFVVTTWEGIHKVAPISKLLCLKAL